MSEVKRFFLGVDPGKDGGLALLDERGLPVDAFLRKTPIITGKRKEYDIPGMGILLSKIADYALVEDAVLVVILEKQQAMPPFFIKGGKKVHAGGSAANYQRGFGFGLWQGLCVGKKISYEVVTPQSWQKAMLAGTNAKDTKQASVIVAKRIWPDIDFRRSTRARKADVGLTDAILIGESGRRRLVGLPEHS